ncbi:hypothetical protein BCR42DRAFT_334811 [Absidia repens]|uniref:RRM domain-containing protein n=1 Tax=Absidia repens TaxID=90262 RepID=A0A1X2I4V2_9FUNG|nr:hypothetical protein BCR42DRAFT_334811 [Absidia repens]
MVNSNDTIPPSVPPYNQSSPNVVILSNLDPNATVNDVKAACGAFGPVTRCELVKDPRGRSCGEAEVEYLDRQSALDCIAKFDNEYIDERIIRATLRQSPVPVMRSVIAPTRSGYRTT